MTDGRRAEDVQLHAELLRRRVGPRRRARQRKTRRFRGVIGGAQRSQGPGGCAARRARRSRSRARSSRRRASEFVDGGARGRRAQQVGPALPAARVEGPRVGSLRQVPDDARAAADAATSRRGDVQRLVDDMTRRGLLGLAGAERRQRAAVAVSLGAGPRAGGPRPGRERAAARDGRQAARSGRDAGGVRAAARARSKPEDAIAVGAGRLRRRRASRRSGCSTGRHVDLKLGAVELAADEEGRKPGGSWRVVPLVKPLQQRLRDGVDRAGPADEGKVCPPRQYSPSGHARRSATSRSACTREWRELGPGADRAARVPPHRGDLARPRRRLAEGRLDAHGPQDARVPAGRRVDHAAALHAHAAGRAGARARSARRVPRRAHPAERGGLGSDSFPRPIPTGHRTTSEPAQGLKLAGASKPVSRRSPAVGRFDSCAAPLRGNRPTTRHFRGLGTGHSVARIAAVDRSRPLG